MIYVQGRFLFIHVPRSAGTSIRTALRQVIDPAECWEIDDTPVGELTRHATATQMRDTLVDYESILKFAVYRHPTDIIRSDYAAAGSVAGGAYGEGLGDFARRRWLSQTGNQTIWDHWTGRDKTIRRLRFDHLAEDFAETIELLSLPPVELPGINSSKSQ